MNEQELINQARAAYRREWNKKNREKVKAAQRRYWLKKAAELLKSGEEVQPDEKEGN